MIIRIALFILLSVSGMVFGMELDVSTEKETAVREKWLDYRECRSNRTQDGFLIIYSDTNQQPQLTYQEATLTIAQDCYYLNYVGKSYTSTMEEQWLSMPMGSRTFDDIRKKKEPFYMYAIQANNQTKILEYAVKITNVIDKAPEVSSLKIIYGIEEEPIKKSSHAFLIGGIGIGISVLAAFIYLMRRMYYSSVIA